MGRFISNQVREQLRPLIRVSSMGIAMVIATVIGFALGEWIDNIWKNISPCGKIVGLLLGIIAGYHNLYIVWKRNNF